MKKLFSISNIYILLWIVYDMQSFIFGRTGSLIAALIVVVLIAVSLYYCGYALMKYKLPDYVKGLTLLLGMFMVYGLVLILSGRKITVFGQVFSNYNYLKEIVISLLPIYPFYVFTRQGKLNEKTIRLLALFFLILTTYSFFYARQQYFNKFQKETTSNIGYRFVSLLPLFVFWYKRRYIQYAGLAVIMLCVLLSFKRGAIITGGICLAIFLYQTTEHVSRKQKIWTVLLSIIVIVAVVFFIQTLLNTNEFFNSRLEATLEGKSGGRDELYSVFWNHFKNESNPLHFLFGNGANATLIISTNYAHNDWLELAINQGVLGLIIYLYYWIMFYKSLRKSSFNNVIHLSLNLLFVICFFKSLFSMSYGNMSLYSNICIGYCMGILNENQNEVQLQI